MTIGGNAILDDGMHCLRRASHEVEDNGKDKAVLTQGGAPIKPAEDSEDKLECLGGLFLHYPQTGVFSFTRLLRVTES